MQLHKCLRRVLVRLSLVRIFLPVAAAIVACRPQSRTLRATNVSLSLSSPQ